MKNAQASKQLKRFATNLRDTTKLGRSIMRNPEIYSALAEDSKDLLVENIKQRMMGRTWGKGLQKNKGKVYAIPTKASSSVQLRWEGEYVQFIEYGAGIYAAKNPHPELIDYTPVSNYRLAKTGKFPENGGRGRNWSGYTNEAWYFKAPTGNGNMGSNATEDYNVVTRGWEPMAPFYVTIIQMRYKNSKQLNYTKYRKAVVAAVKQANANLVNNTK